MRMNVRVADGEPRAILLTRRLLDRLVPALAERMERGAPPGRIRDVLLSMARERARQARDTAPPPRPVEMPVGAPAPLCVAVRLDVTTKGLALAFRDGTGLELLLSAATADTCAFLDTVARVYARAGWSREACPAWFEAEDRAGAQDFGRVLN